MFFNPGIAQMGLDTCYGFHVAGYVAIIQLLKKVQNL